MTEPGATSDALTRLATMRADAVQVHAQRVSARVPPPLSKQLRSRARYVEGFAVHELQPAPSHPFLLVPFGRDALLRGTTRGPATPAGLSAGAGVAGRADGRSMPTPSHAV